MKQSKYNFFYKLERDKYIAFNALKNGLGAVGSKTIDKVLSLKPNNKIEVDDIISQELVKGGFICEDDFYKFDALIIPRNVQQYTTTDLGLVSL